MIFWQKSGGAMAPPGPPYIGVPGTLSHIEFPDINASYLSDPKSKEICLKQLEHIAMIYHLISRLQIINLVI